MISAVVLHELAYGADKSGDPTRSHAVLKDFLVGVDVLDFDSQDSMAAGAIRSALSKNGMTIGAYDTLIAGQALARKYVMVTGNGTEFSRVVGLKIADWGKS